MTNYSEKTAMIRLALLVCDTPVPPVLEVYGDYLAIFTRLFEVSLPDPQVKFSLDAFDVVTKQEYPALDADYDAVVITGSAASAYADLPWIPPLLSYIQNIVKQKPLVKIIGICFGHQAVARALGGECVPNGRWEIGVTDVQLTNAGQEIFGVPQIRIQQMHRDHVPSLPPKFILLGSTPVSLIQGMILPYESSPAQTHIFCVQGHPEFLPDMVNKIIDVREKSGVLSDAATLKEARERAVREDDGKGIIGKAIWKVLGVEAPK